MVLLQYLGVAFSLLIGIFAGSYVALSAKEELDDGAKYFIILFIASFLLILFFSFNIFYSYFMSIILSIILSLILYILKGSNRNYFSAIVLGIILFYTELNIVVLSLIFLFNMTLGTILYHESNKIFSKSSIKISSLFFFVISVLYFV